MRRKPSYISASFLLVLIILLVGLTIILAVKAVLHASGNYCICAIISLIATLSAIHKFDDMNRRMFN